MNELPDDRHSVMDDEMHVDHPDWPEKAEPAPYADRLSTYAEAMVTTQLNDGETFEKQWVAADAEEREDVLRIARAVMALADLEQAPLLARIAELEAEAGQLRGQVYAEQIRIDNHRLYEGDLRKSLADKRAKVARVEALPEEWRRASGGRQKDIRAAARRFAIRECADMLDAALAGDAEPEANSLTCPACNNYRDTPGHELGCSSGAGGGS